MQVVLQLQPHSGGGSKEVNLTRQAITFNPVSSELCAAGTSAPGKTGYIRIATFSKQTPAGVRAAMKTLQVWLPQVGT